MFKSKLVLSPKNHGYVLSRSLVYLTQDITIAVPSGFFTDLASIPRAARVIMARDDKGLLHASVIHDWLYSLKSVPDHHALKRKTADKVFLAIMLETGAGKFKAYLAYLAVRSAGWLFFKKQNRVR